MVANIPSISVPFVDSQGRISPIWHEFLRVFVTATVEGTVSEGNAVTNIEAGNGLTSADVGSTRTMTVGQGNGIAVNANDVAVNISDQTYVLPSLDDEILVSDFSDNNLVGKTRVRDIASLAGIPGGSSFQIQYNDQGIFGGDSGFSTDGEGSLTIDGDLSVDNLVLNGNTLSSSSGDIVLSPAGDLDVNATMKVADSNGDLNISGATFATESNLDKFLFTVPTGSATPHFVFTQSGTGNSAMPFDIKCVGATVELNLNNNSEGGGNTLPESLIRFLSEGSVKWSMGLTSEATGYGFTLGTTSLSVGNVFTIDAANTFFNINTALIRKTLAGLSASTTQSQGQGALTAEINEVATCANANDVVTLPAASAGRYCLVINNGAQTLQVFPASGDDLGAGVNTSTTITSGSRKLFIAYNATSWEPVI